MKLKAYSAAVCTATALSCVFALTPVAFAEGDTTAGASGDEAVIAPAPDNPATDAAAYTSKIKKGYTFSVGKATYKVVKATEISRAVKSDVVGGTASETTHKFSGQVELVSYKGGKKANVPAGVTAKTKPVKDAVGNTDVDTGTFTVVSIGKNAFDNAKGHKITSVSIGKNVVSIGEKAFYKCKKLTRIALKGDAIRTIGCNSDKSLKRSSKSYVKKLYKLRTKKWKTSHVFEGVPRHCEIKLPNINADKHLSYNINYANAIRLLAGHAKYVGLVK